MAERHTVRKNAAVADATPFTVRILEATSRATARKLANAEIQFAGGALDGLVLAGFAVWVNEEGSGESVTFSSRQFSVSGQPRSFSLSRWIAKREAQERMADAVFRSYRRYRRRSAGSVS